MKLEILYRQEGNANCMTITNPEGIPVPGQWYRRRTMARIYRDGVSNYSIHARNGEATAINGPSALAIAAKLAGVDTIPQDWYEIARQFDEETYADALEDDALTAET